MFLCLLGQPRIDPGSGCIVLEVERRFQVLCYLASRGSWVGRAEVAAVFWPELPAKLSHANLRKAIHRLRELSWGDILQVRGTQLRVEVPTDKALIEAAAREWRTDELVAGAGAPFLAGFEEAASTGWSAWLEFERSRLRALWRKAALERLAGLEDPDDALALGEELLRAEPADEDAARALMVALVRTGRPQAAKAAYEKYEASVRAIHGIDPGAEVRAVYQSLRHDAMLPTAKPPEELVGRKSEVAVVVQKLQDPACRLVTLVGPGGIGKTRIANRVFELQAVAAPQDACFVSLEAVANPEELVPMIVAQLQISLAPGDPAEQLAIALRGRRMLIMLDNFEHLAGAAPAIDSLLSQCPGLKVLVTSRVRLGLASEWVVPVAGLPCPQPEDDDRAEAFDAVRLFVQSARRADPDFVPTDTRAIAEICRRVDGMPLGLQLAGGWAGLLTPRRIAQELARGTEVLRAPEGSRSGRHSSIESVFEHSWTMLGAEERICLARLAVFRGGFTVEAALEVGVPLPILGALSGRSLVRKDAGRASLHPLIGQLANRKLEGETRTHAETAHARYYANLLRHLRQGAEFGDRRALNLLDAEYENWMAVWAWLVGRRDHQGLLPIVRTVRAYFVHAGRAQEGWELFRRALPDEAPDDGALPAILHAAMAQCSERLSRYRESLDEAERAIALCPPDRGEDRLDALITIARCHARSLLFQDPARAVARARAFLPDVGNPRFEAELQYLEAAIARRADKPTEAIAHVLPAIAEFRRQGDCANEATSLCLLAYVQSDIHDAAASAVSLRAALELCEANGLWRMRAYVLAGLLEVAVQQGDLEGAWRYAVECLELCRTRVSAPLLDAWALIQHARIAARRQSGGAMGYLMDAMKSALRLDDPGVQLQASIIFAEVLLHEGRRHAAELVLGFVRHQKNLGMGVRSDLEELVARWSLRLPAGTRAFALHEFVARVVDEAASGQAKLFADLPAGP